MPWDLSGNRSTNPVTQYLGTQDRQPLVIRTNGAERLRVGEDGNVGVGTVQPREKLEVDGGAIVNHVSVGSAVAGIDYQFHEETVGVTRADGNLRLQSPQWIMFHTGPRHELRGQITGDGTLEIGAGGRMGNVSVGSAVDGIDYQFHEETVGVTRADGNLRLQSPQWIMFHTGPGRELRGQITGDGTLEIRRDVHASDFFIASDVRLKSRVAPLGDVLDKVERISGVSFEWAPSGSMPRPVRSDRQIGLLAQEVASEFPELVTSRDGDGYFMVSYARVTAILVEAIKELRREKDQQLAAVRAEIATLRQRDI
jgi:hypothetical protein